MNNNKQQRLFWSVSKPLKYLGLTLDEWLVTIIGVIPGLILLNSGNVRLGFSLFIGGVLICWLFKKYKRLSTNFKIKSFLIAKGLLKAPAGYPKLLKKQRVGR
jgi:hypothetical protein